MLSPPVWHLVLALRVVTLIALFGLTAWLISSLHAGLLIDGAVFVVVMVLIGAVIHVRPWSYARYWSRAQREAHGPEPD
jgi:hypothetical protein